MDGTIHRREIAAVLGAAAILASACGVGAAGPPAALPMAAAPATTHEMGTRVEVTMTEYSFDFPDRTLKPGTYTFMLDNRGDAPHAMAIRGPGMEEAETSDRVDGGERTEFTVTLRPGRYQVWCPVGDHRQEGMETTLTVE
ncbi:hypothetical protein [Thermoactinospora rubra]|uniref:hypothetical protein n=1 Tax=Thermoactinospora rubra TaxID=1088767 RepID=UPI000A11B31E|nr:hypothetical protein [Thermoactinospora rubra]